MGLARRTIAGELTREELADGRRLALEAEAAWLAASGRRLLTEFSPWV